MESAIFLGSDKQELVETLPPLIKYISSNEVVGFDSIEENGSLSNPSKESEFPALGVPAREIEAAVVLSHRNKAQPMDSQRMQCVSISMPSSPTLSSLKGAKGVLFSDHSEAIAMNAVPDSSSISITASNIESKQAKFHSQPIPKLSSFMGAANGEHFPHPTRISRFKDKRFDSFKTWSGKLERQLSNLRGKPTQEIDEEDNVVHKPDMESFPVDRYFDALEGPELETLRPSEEILLPEDKEWPFLLRFPVSSFGICLGVGSQAIMWKTLATSASIEFLHVSLTINLILWCIAVFLIVIVSSIYLLKVVFYFEAVRREYFHPIRVNFFFSPWIALLFLALGVPPAVCTRLHESLWYILMAPIFCLELKIYGQWMSGGQRRLSKVANPSNHLSIVGNFVGALLGASMGLKEGPIFFFAIGMAHYTVLFVTLYQRLPTNATLPKELHPVFFLFVAAPSVASMAWAKIQGSFDYGARIAYFIALFLYFSLAVRVNFFRGFRFSLAWWAYTFPMTGASVATIHYTNEVTTPVTQALSVILSAFATLTVTALLVNTILHAFILRDLFPNDVGIAISERRPKTSKRWFRHLRLGSSDTRDIENFLKFACPDTKATEPSNSDEMKIV